MIVDGLEDFDSTLDNALAGNGACTLREAVNNANGDTTAGDCAAGSRADQISVFK